MDRWRDLRVEPPLVTEGDVRRTERVEDLLHAEVRRRDGRIRRSVEDADAMPIVVERDVAAGADDIREQARAFVRRLRPEDRLGAPGEHNAWVVAVEQRRAERVGVVRVDPVVDLQPALATADRHRARTGLALAPQTVTREDERLESAPWQPA